MSCNRFRLTVGMMLALCMACVCWNSGTAGSAPNPTVVFQPLPTPGGVKGSYSVGLAWANCGNNIGEVGVNCWSGTGANKKIFDQPTFVATKQNPILAKGSTTWNRTGFKTGDVIATAEGLVWDPQVNVIVTTGPLDKNSLPVAFAGCTIP